LSLSVAVSEDWPPRAPCVMPVRDTVIDRSNHHLFQPLLYQVATAMLAPGDIAAPICHLLRRQRNVTVAMAEVTGVDAANRRVLVNYLGRPDMPFAYDYLILATGASHSYFGHNEFAPFAPGMTSLLDAESVRAKVLKAFETAETARGPGAASRPAHLARARPTGPISCARATGAAPARPSQRARLGGQP